MHRALKRILFACGDADDLPAFIKAASRADPVRDVGFATLRTGAHLRKFEHAIVGPAHTLAASGRFAFWYTHKFFCLKMISLRNNAVQRRSVKFQFVQLRPC